LDTSKQAITESIAQAQSKLDAFPEQKAQLLASFEEAKQSAERIKRGVATQIRMKALSQNK